MKILFPILAALCVVSAVAQNVVDGRGESARVVEAVELPEKDCEIVFVPVQPKPMIASAEAKRIATKLDAHVNELIAGWPWKPMHHTLGISGVEVDFDHPDEVFYALALAQPCLPRVTQDKVREFLATLLKSSAPYAIDGFERDGGQSREHYAVPAELRIKGRGKALSAFGVYAFWLYDANVTAGAERDHWPALASRTQFLLDSPYAFDIRKIDHTHDQAQRLNGDLAGLIAFSRLATRMEQPDLATRAHAKAIELLRLRVNLERVNPRFVEKTSASSKGLHNFKLARYCDLVPEVAAALRTHTDDLAAQRLRTFREARNGWFMAFGDRMIGGENYTNPLAFSHALFTGAALIERVPQDDLLRWIDIPWCKADLYFIEKCAIALTAGGS